MVVMDAKQPDDFRYPVVFLVGIVLALRAAHSHSARRGALQQNGTDCSAILFMPLRHFASKLARVVRA